jgi:hypothetical protein
VGQRLLDSSAKALTRQSLDSLHQQIKARLQNSNMTQTNSNPTTVAAASIDTSAEPAPSVEAPSQTQFAVGVAKYVLDDLISHERRMLLLAGALGVLALIVVLNWWTNKLARQVADIVWERR